MDRCHHLWDDIANLVSPFIQCQTFGCHTAMTTVSWMQASQSTTLSAHRTTSRKWDAYKDDGLSLFRCKPGLKELTHNKYRTLKWACKYGYMDVLNFLQTWHFSWRKPYGFREHKCLIKAIKHGNVNVLQFLNNWMDDSGLSLRKTLNATFHCEALTMASHFGHINILQYFKEWDVSLKKIVRREGLGFLTEAKDVETMQFFKDWRWTPIDSTDPGRLMVSDLRHNNNLALFYLAIFRRDTSLCQFFKDWRDESGDRLKYEDVAQCIQNITDRTCRDMIECMFGDLFVPPPTISGAGVKGVTYHGSSTF